MTNDGEEARHESNKVNEAWNDRRRGEGLVGGVHIVLVPYKKRNIAALRQCEADMKNRRKN